MNLKNLALGYVKTAPSPATTGTSLTLETGEGARFPETTTESFYVTLAPADANAHSENSEVVEVTDRTGDVLTIVRGRRGTTAQSVAVGWIVLNSVYKEDLDGLSSNSLCRQAIINGGFTVNQRVYVSNATLSAGVYGHDRWKAGASGGDYTFTQLAQSTQITIKTGKSLIQVIEDKNVVGGTYTLSWEGTAQARFGKDSATPSGVYASSPITITGQSAGTVMSVEFNEGTLGKVQLNTGSIALPFMPKSFEEELRTCMRYYEKSFIYTTTPANNIVETVYRLDGTAYDTENCDGYGQFFVKKRISPVITLYGSILGNTVWAYLTTSWIACTSNSCPFVNENGFIVRLTKTGAFTAGTVYSVSGHWVADAEL